MDKSTKIDYMQFSTKYKMTAMLFESDFKRSFMQNFSYMVEDNETGLTCHFGHNLYPDTHTYVATGSTCDEIFSSMDEREYIGELIENGAKFTRLDFAMTMYQDWYDFISVSDFVNAVSSGLMVSKAYSKSKAIVDIIDNRPETAYVGDIKKRADKGIFRCYDKGIETGIVENFVTRFELEERKEKAHTSAKRFVNGASHEQIIKSRIDFPKWDAWQSLVGDENISVGRGIASSRKDDSVSRLDNRWNWLIEKVAPSIAKSIYEDMLNERGHENWIAFNDAIRRNYNMLTR